MCHFVRSVFKGMLENSRTLDLRREIPTLHAMVSRVGYQKVSTNDYCWDGTKRGRTPFAIFQYTLAGMGQLRYQGMQLDCPPGSMMVVYIPGNHQYFFSPKHCHRNAMYWQFFYLILHGSEVMRLVRGATKRHGPVYQKDEIEGTIHQAALLCHRLQKGKQELCPYEVSSSAYALCMSLLRETNTRNSPNVPFTFDIERIKTYVREHLDESLSVDQLADIAGYSRFHFSRLFEQAEGITPAKWVRQCRLAISAEQLALTTKPIKQIAKDCGFSSFNYFIKAFHKHFQTTPHTYRTSGMYVEPVRQGRIAESSE